MRCGTVKLVVKMECKRQRHSATEENCPTHDILQSRQSERLSLQIQNLTCRVLHFYCRIIYGKE